MKASLLVRLADQPSALDHLLTGLTEEQLKQRPQPEKWSILENLAHLGRYQEVFLERIHQINTGAIPQFDPYVADNDPGFADWAQLPVEALFSQLRGERAALNAFLSVLHEEQLVNIGLHPVYGPMTIEGWTEFFLLHEAHHFFTILKVGGAMRTNQQPMGLSSTSVM